MKYKHKHSLDLDCLESHCQIWLCLGQQWFYCGDNFPCYPLMQSISI